MKALLLRPTIAISAGLVAVAILVGGAVLLASNSGEKTELTTATLVPDDAFLYLALNTDLTSGDWITAFKLAERMGQEDPETALKERLTEEQDLDWEEDMAPFLGGNLAFFVTSFDPNSAVGFQGGVVLKAKDVAAALEWSLADDNFDFQTETYQGTEYYVDGYSGVAMAVFGQHLAFGFDEKTLLSIIDVSKGKKGALADLDDFKSSRERVVDSFLGFAYLDTRSLYEAFIDASGMEELFDQGASLDDLQPAAMVIGARGDGFTLDAVSAGGEDSPMLQARTSRFVGMVPADTAFFLTTTAVGPEIERSLTDSEAQMEESLASSGLDWESLLGTEVAADVDVGDVLDALYSFDGELAVAVWFPTGDEGDADGLLMAEVSDVDRVRSLVEDLVAQRNTLETVTVAGVEVFKSVENEGAFAFHGSDFLIGTLPAVTRVLEGDGPFLATSPTYVASVASLPRALGSYVFADIGSLLRLSGAGLPPELDEVEQALDGLILNMVQEDGYTRVSGIITVAE